MKNKLIIFLILLFATLIVVTTCLKNRNSLRTDGVLTTGFVDKVYSGSKGGLNIDYHFYTETGTIEGSEFYFISSSYIKEFEHKSFPVKYSPTKPTKNRMLILKNDFEEMEEAFPDSLKWTLDLKGL